MGDVYNKPSEQGADFWGHLKRSDKQFLNMYHFTLFAAHWQCSSFSSPSVSTQDAVRNPQHLSSPYTDKSVKPKTRNESEDWDHQWRDEWRTNYNGNKTRWTQSTRDRRRPIICHCMSVFYATLTVIQISHFIFRVSVSSVLNIAYMNNYTIRGHTYATQHPTHMALQTRQSMWSKLVKCTINPIL